MARLHLRLAKFPVTAAGTLRGRRGREVGVRRGPKAWTIPFKRRRLPRKGQHPGAGRAVHPRQPGLGGYRPAAQALRATRWSSTACVL